MFMSPSPCFMGDYHLKNEIIMASYYYFLETLYQNYYHTPLQDEYLEAMEV